MKRIFITGANGCLGKALCKYLKSQNKYSVFATSKQVSLHSDGLLDVTKGHDLKKSLETQKPDIIFHIASSYSTDFKTAYTINVESSKNLLDTMLTFPSTRIVLMGSAAEYGYVEKHTNPVSEDVPLKPISQYGMLKAWQTLMLAPYHKKGVNVVIARLFNLYGDNMSESLLIGRVQKQIRDYKAGKINTITTGDLSAYRDYISTEEAVSLLETIALKGEAGQIYNVGTGIPLKCRDLVYDLLKNNNIDKDILFENKEIKVPRNLEMIYANMTKTRELINE